MVDTEIINTFFFKMDPEISSGGYLDINYILVSDGSGDFC